MKTVCCQVAIIGSGFGGCLLGCILRRQGMDVIIVDRQKHPRFAIGESSTPIADAVLARLCKRYDLPELAPLAHYGAARRNLPKVTLGVKRGFSYFFHEPDRPFVSDSATHSRELLVTANASEEVADTHWYRPEVDLHFAQTAKRAGAQLWEEFNIESVEAGRFCHIRGFDGSGEPARIDCRLIIDASGAGRVMVRELGIQDVTHQLRTNSRAVFGHFADVRTWADVLDEINVDRSDYPFPVDQAAVHHVLREGWMWQLRFDNGLTSLGFALACQGDHLANRDPLRQWQTLCMKYPSLNAQFGEARRVYPLKAPASTGRLQFLAESAAGEGWACLPHSAGFIDPLHSSGIAHTLSAVEQLARVLESGLDQPDLAESLLRYGKRVIREIMQIDRLVSVCYDARNDFKRFELACMLYFAAAIHQEHQRVGDDPPPSFLCTDDRVFVELVEKTIREWGEDPQAPHDAESLAAAEAHLRERLEPYNHVGLLEPSVNRMYHYTSAPSKRDSSPSTQTPRGESASRHSALN